LEKPGKNPGFSLKSREAVPKTEVLEQPQVTVEAFPKLTGFWEWPGKLEVS
jgi:hypothetical protein